MARDLLASSKALLALDADGALVPHGLGGHGRGCLTWCVEEIERLRIIIEAEREACARVASGCSDRDCDDRGSTDPETGEVPCAAEARGEVCVCAELSDLAHGIAGKIRARSA